MASDHITDAQVETAGELLFVRFGVGTAEEYRSAKGEERRRDFDGVVRAALLAAERAAWQSIETAPRDGRWVQLFVRCAGFNVVGCGYWVHDLGGNWITRGYSDPPGNLGLARPTHWRPLPPPPELSHD